MEDTRDPQYAKRLASLGDRGWKKFFNVQAPYRWNLDRLQLGRTLDIGCGLGRNLINLHDGVGVDHNAEAIQIARSKGLNAYTTSEWELAPEAVPASFDTILMAHVLEHMSLEESDMIVSEYIKFLRPKGKMVLICPQEKGFPTDPTHVRWVDEQALRETGARHGFEEQKNYSFPFGRRFGRYFTYNEFVYVGIKP
jgi:2-polyprenyl-3-methyl-5-hydroxy-6-metoxy-1,4-benzoquinol methylase